MPARTYEAASSYRYGFNKKERDKDINSLTAYDYGFRIYNPAIGRFLSVDPLTKSYPWYTPYQFAGNMPINSIDLDGLENKEMTYYVNISANGETQLKVSVHDYGKDGGVGPRGKGILITYMVDHRSLEKNENYGKPGNNLSKMVEIPHLETTEIFVPEPTKPRKGLFQRIDEWFQNLSVKEGEQGGGFYMTKALTSDAKDVGGDPNSPTASNTDVLDHADMMISVLGLAGGVEPGAIQNITNQNKILGEKLASLFESIGHTAHLGATLDEKKMQLLEDLTSTDDEMLQPNATYSLDFEKDRNTSWWGILTYIRTDEKGRVKDTIVNDNRTGKSDTIPNKNYRKSKH